MCTLRKKPLPFSVTEVKKNKLVNKKIHLFICTALLKSPSRRVLRHTNNACLIFIYLFILSIKIKCPRYTNSPTFPFWTPGLFHFIVMFYSCPSHVIYQRPKYL